ncbi:class I SAM-dependent methyltransferase [[Clostridium] aminophilum]|uniref:class I SAM-dependent methyltransferase n=1 Tax=[Clostridium] aminophilum TaxID=1526 RepID=UPI003F9DA53A
MENKNYTEQDLDKMSPMEITELGNPAKPEGAAGARMLARMNESHREVTEWGLSHAEFRPEDTILDIGCGGGRTLESMAEKSSKGKLWGVDVSPVSVEESRKRNEKRIAEGRMEILEGSAAKLPFADQTFDKVTTVESFYFWPDAMEGLKEVLRVLKPDGTFLLIADVYETGDLPENVRENIAKFHMRNPTPADFRHMFVDAGFWKTEIHRKEGTTWICVEGTKY